MKTQTLIEAISFIMAHEPTKKYIREYEAPPKDFEIFQVSAAVASYDHSVVRVLINFVKRGNSRSLSEDVFIDIQGSGLTNFRIIKITPVSVSP